MGTRRLCAFLNGLGGLLVELALFKILSVRLGTSTGAVALVLAAFLSGLGAAYLLFGREGLPRIWDRTVLVWTQVFGALFAALAPWIFGAVEAAAAHSTWLLQGPLVFVVVAAGALPAGAAVPLLYRLGRPSGAGRGAAIGALYGWNAAGGVAGVLLGTFWLLPAWGLMALFGTAALAFLSTGAFVLFAGEEKSSKERKIPPRQDRSLSPVPATLLAAAFGAGCAALILETCWERVLAIYLPNRSTSFGLVLALYLSGTALGSLFASRTRIEGERSAARAMSLFMGLSFLSLAALPLIWWLPDLLFSIRHVFATPWRQVFLPPILLALCLVFPPAFLMGAALPRLVASCPGEGPSRGMEVGRVFGLNFAGSVAGALLGGLVLMPILGVQRGILAAGCVYLLIAGLLRPTSGGVRHPSPVRLAALVLLTLMTAGSFLFIGRLPRPLPVSASPSTPHAGSLLFYDESADGTVCVVENEATAVRTAFINNAMVCGTTPDALKTVRMLAHLPLLAADDPKRVLVIGFGMGVTAGNVLSHPVRRVDCVELCPSITAAAALFSPENRNPLDDPRLRMHGGDGRSWLKRSGEHYDVITCDPTHPTLGSGNLYTREFFRLAASRLTPGGTFAQFCPLTAMTEADLRTLAATFLDVFPDATLWYSGAHAVLLGSNGGGPLTIDPSRWTERLEASPAGADLRRSSLSRVYDWLGLLALCTDDLRRFSEGSSVATDLSLSLEFPGIAAQDPSSWMAARETLLAYRDPRSAEGLLSPDGGGDRAIRITDRFYEARTLMLQAGLARDRGDWEGAERLLAKARRINWDDAEIRMAHEAVLEILRMRRLARAQGSTSKQPPEE